MKIKNLDNKYTVKPPTGEKWDFENAGHKKQIKLILIEKQGMWCRMCGVPYALSIHHVRARGKVPKNMLLIDIHTMQVFYRDDPFNLVFLCLANRNCHDWVQNHENKAIEMNRGLAAKPVSYEFWLKTQKTRRS